MFDLDISARSDKGCVRLNNEDMVLVDTRMLRDGSLLTEIGVEHSGRLVLAVADGLGGHASGEVASEMVLLSLSRFFYGLPGGLGIEDLKHEFNSWLQYIHQEVNSNNQVEVGCQNCMGTTLVALFFYEDRVFWINCGDSRLYRYRGGILSHVSKDHSLREMTGSECDSNIIVNCIGAGSSSCYIDFIEISGRVLDGDCFLLCSDGLSDMCSDEELEGVLCRGGNAHELVNAAIAHGGNDNVSVVLAGIRKYEFLEGKEIVDYAIDVTRQITCH